MAKVGIPYLRLDRLDHFDKSKNKHTGNCRAVILEGLQERQSSDPDLDRSKTHLNKYYGIQSGEELVNMLESNAETFTKADKRGIERHLKNKASIGYALVIKPEKSYIDSLSVKDQERFFDDSFEVLRTLIEARGMVVDTAVIHWDESNSHMHIYGHDPNYDLGRKFNLKMCDDFNRGYYPKQMRARGWDVEDLPRNYDPEYANTLTEDELIEYKRQCKEKRKKNGKPSKVYKADKEASKILAEANNKAAAIITAANQRLAEADQRLAEAEAYERDLTMDKIDLDDLESVLEARRTSLDDLAENIKAREEKCLKRENKALEREKALNARETSLEARKVTLDRQAKDIRDREEKALKMANRNEFDRQSLDFRELNYQTMLKDVKNFIQDVSDYRLQQQADRLTERLKKLSMPSMTPTNNGIDRQYE